MKITKTRLLLFTIILISLYYFFTNLKEGLDVKKPTETVPKPMDKKKVDSLIVSAITDKLNMYVPVVSSMFNSVINTENNKHK